MVGTRKRIVPVGAALVLALALSACAAPSDEDGIREALESELSPIEQLDDGFVQAVAASMSGELDPYGIDAADFVEAYFDGFAYEVGAIDVDGGFATAEVTMTCKSAEPYVYALQEAAMTVAESGSLSGASSDEVALAAGGLMLEALESVEPVETAVSVSLERSDGEWVVSEGSASEITRALMGS